MNIKGKKVLFYDIMMGGRFVCTMRHYYLPCFKVKLEEIVEEVFLKRPSLRKKRFSIVADEFEFVVDPKAQSAN